MNSAKIAISKKYEEIYGAIVRENTIVYFNLKNQKISVDN